MDVVWCDVVWCGEVWWGGAREGMHFSQLKNALLLNFHFILSLQQHHWLLGYCTPNLFSTTWCLLAMGPGSIKSQRHQIPSNFTYSFLGTLSNVQSLLLPESSVFRATKYVFEAIEELVLFKSHPPRKLAIDSWVNPMALISFLSKWHYSLVFCYLGYLAKKLSI